MLITSFDMIDTAAWRDNNPGRGSLDDMLIRETAHQSGAVYQDKMEVLGRVNDANKAMSIDELSQIQVRSANYALNINLTSTLVRKGVTTIDTLLRA